MNINICQLMFVRITKIGNMYITVMPAITPAQVGTDPLLRGFGVSIITIVQDHELDVTEERLHGVIIWTAFR